ncbi:MAG: MerR family transcriptional regulator [Proteobacteria bacterium]|nr:MerR family transcriptional regulator [Pseudomonadota bacterium]
MTKQTGKDAEDGDVSLVKISALARLAGVPTPTIKHYMREGLLPGPVKRTSRNVAYYDSRLAARVRIIKELQQTRFLPLKVIAELLEPAPSSSIRADLDEIQRRQLGMLTPAVEAGTEQARVLRTGRTQAQLSREAVLSSLRVTDEELDLLENCGLAQASRDDRGASIYSGPDLELLEIIDETRRTGMGELFTLDIIEPYTRAIQDLVRFEIDLFRRRALAGAKLPDMSLDEIARLATVLGGRLVAVMRDKLVVHELNAISTPGDRSAGE